jgi:hypothetical protein
MWYELLWAFGEGLKRRFPKSFENKSSQALAQVFLDQTVGVAIFFPLYFFVFECIESLFLEGYVRRVFSLGGHCDQPQAGREDTFKHPMTSHVSTSWCCYASAISQICSSTSLRRFMSHVSILSLMYGRLSTLCGLR